MENTKKSPEIFRFGRLISFPERVSRALVWPRRPQQEIAANGRKGGAGKDTDLRFRLHEVGREGEKADEDAHRKADAAKNGDAVKLNPACAHRLFGKPRFDGEPGRAEDAELLAEEKAEQDAECQRVAQDGSLKPLEGNARIGKSRRSARR